MYYTIKKLEQDDPWSEDFQYSIVFERGNGGEISLSGVVAYHNSVRWFTSRFGWSHCKETRDAIRECPSDSPHYQLNTQWAYESKYFIYRIFTNEEELVFFQLSHQQH